MANFKSSDARAVRNQQADTVKSADPKQLALVLQECVRVLAQVKGM